MPNNSSASVLNIRLFQGLSRIPSDWQLCLLDGKKVPQGLCWQQKPLTPVQMKEAVTNGWTVDKADGTQYRCYPKGYGLITGTAIAANGITYYLMAVDQDGASARAKILELSDGEELPHTVAFTSNRPGRCQYLFLVPEQYAGAIRTKKFPTGEIGDDGKGEQLELRWAGLQSCLPPSVHPTTGEYVWRLGCAPDETSVALAPQWIVEQMLAEPLGESENSELLPLEKALEEAEANSTAPRRRHLHRTHRPEPEWTDIDWALSYLAALSPPRADNYDEWCGVGMVLNSIDDSLLYEWDKWSRQSLKYKPGECDKKWRSFKSSGVGIGTLAHWAKQDGWTSPFKGHNAANSQKNGQQKATQNSQDISNASELNSNNQNSEKSDRTGGSEPNSGSPSNGSGVNRSNSDHYLYDRVTAIINSEINPPQQTAAFIELSARERFPLKGVKDLATEIETHISYGATHAQEVQKLKKILNYRQQQLDIAQILPAPLAQAILTKATSDRIDPIYIYQYLLSACGSQMGGHIGMIGKEAATIADSWVEYPIFWTMVVALASAGKSQTMRAVFGTIKQRYKRAKSAYDRLKENLKKLEEAWPQKSTQEKEKLKNSPSNPAVFKASMPPPVPKQFIEAGSPEGVLRRMSELSTRTGSAWVFDELVRLLKLDQYKDKGGDTRQILLQMWNSPADIEFERADDKDAFELKDLCLNLTGATQLSKVQQLFSDPDDGDGLISRFLIAVPSTPDNFAVWSDSQVAISGELQELYDHLRSLHGDLRELAGLSATSEGGELPPVLLSFTTEAHLRWKRWWEEVRRNQQAVEFEDPAFYAYLGKMLSQTLRLALLLHCMELKYEEKPDPLRVGLDTLERAIAAAKFSIGQFRILQTNNHASDSAGAHLSLIYTYALRKGEEVSAAQVQNSVFKRCKRKPTLAEIRSNFAVLTENGYALLSGKGNDLRIRALPLSKTRVGIPTDSGKSSGIPEMAQALARVNVEPPLTRNSGNSDTPARRSGNLQDEWVSPASSMCASVSEAATAMPTASELEITEESPPATAAPTVSESEIEEESPPAQMCRNCRNSDIDEVSEVEPEPIVGDENLSENGRNEVGISDELGGEDDDANSEWEGELDPSDDANSEWKGELDLDDDSDLDSDPLFGDRVPKPTAPLDRIGSTELAPPGASSVRGNSDLEAAIVSDRPALLPNPAILPTEPQTSKTPADQPCPTVELTERPTLGESEASSP
ncbi:DUF3987 domain-containing protein [Microcoleus sp. herbarium14]|uniref:DUF3987 domain-containing protein n=2 Tax=unclassified Microcoleus TaxID=2642155 RepID=UPI002FD2F1B4